MQYSIWFALESLFGLHSVTLVAIWFGAVLISLVICMAGDRRVHHQSWGNNGMDE